MDTEFAEKIFDPSEEGVDISYGWEEGYKKAWEAVAEVQGVFVDTNNLPKKTRETVAARYQKRRELESVRRGLVRFVVLLIDSSEAMLELDFKPDRIRCTSVALQHFITSFFADNPISHMAIILLRNGVSTLVLPFSSMVSEINAVIATELEVDKCTGSASFQLGLDRAYEVLQAVPTFCTREIFCIWGSLRTLDSGDVFKSIESIQSAKGRISVVSYAPEIYILKESTKLTGGSFQVAISDLNLQTVCLPSLRTPPIWSVDEGVSRLVPMGFPSLRGVNNPSVCVCHLRGMTGGFQCPCCASTVCSVPTRCATCGLFLARATDLAQCYRHIFPVVDFKLQEDDEKTNKMKITCQGCLKKDCPLVDCLQCPKCGWLFCDDCDLFIHETLYSCPGCAANVTLRDSNEETNEKKTDSVIGDEQKEDVPMM
eukprot:GDKJ01017962.1.p1 GENE.GDKJ01017962.1~~GDKJ01017962.1.p1  ORF type:complete len:428 (-),score=49.93 GDKJ01017962.1:67-1350(-)